MTKTATSEHTPEPWTLYGPFDDGYVGISSGEEQPGKRRMVARTDSPTISLPQTERDANARRIVACVNACAGIETEALENFEDIKADAAKRAEALATRLQRIAAIIEHADKRDSHTIDDEGYSATKMRMAELSEIYTLATLDRPVVDPLLEVATIACRRLVAWDDGEKAGPDYGTLTRDTHPQGEKIWREWWTRQQDICTASFDAARTFLAKLPERKPNV